MPRTAPSECYAPLLPLPAPRAMPLKRSTKPCCYKVACGRRCPAAELCLLLLPGLLLAASDAWTSECGSDDCSRFVPANVSLADPYFARRLPVVQSSMPLAFNIVADASGRAFVGSLDGSFTCLSVASGAVLWTVALGFGPLSSAAALCVCLPHMRAFCPAFWFETSRL